MDAAAPSPHVKAGAGGLTIMFITPSSSLVLLLLLMHACLLRVRAVVTHPMTTGSDAWTRAVALLTACRALPSMAPLTATQVCGNQDSVSWLLGWLMEWKCGSDGEGEIGWLNGQLCNTAVVLGPVGVSSLSPLSLHHCVCPTSTSLLVCVCALLGREVPQLSLLYRVSRRLPLRVPAERKREDGVSLRLCRRAGLCCD
jgi:hypothetical protein